MFLPSLDFSENSIKKNKQNLKFKPTWLFVIFSSETPWWSCFVLEKAPLATLLENWQKLELAMLS